MTLTNPGTPFDEDGWADALTDIRKLSMRENGGIVNDMNAASFDVSQLLSDDTDLNKSIVDSLNPNNPNNAFGGGGGQNINLPLAVNQGGTGAQTAPKALKNLGAMWFTADVGILTTYTGIGAHAHIFNNRSTLFAAILRGGGGGGGGGLTPVDDFDTGTGGGGGGQGAIKFIWGRVTNPIINLVVGSGGTGGSSGGGVGTAGGDTTEDMLTNTAGGGGGGSTNGYDGGGNPGAVSGMLAIHGQRGEPGILGNVRLVMTGTTLVAVSGSLGIGAKGGGPLNIAGSGGRGGDATLGSASGTVGIAGYVSIFEI